MFQRNGVYFFYNKNSIHNSLGKDKKCLFSVCVYATLLIIAHNLKHFIYVFS